MKHKIIGLDENLITDKIELLNNVYHAHCHLKKSVVYCPNCGLKTSSIHSKYRTSFYDLPIQGKPVLIILTKLKYICRNRKCSTKTFTISTDFISPKGKKTKRLIKAIVNLNKDMSSIQTSKNLKDMGIIAKKSAICSYLKKNTNN